MTSDLHMRAHICVCEPTYKLIVHTHSHTHTQSKTLKFENKKLNKDTKIQ